MFTSQNTPLFYAPVYLCTSITSQTSVLSGLLSLNLLSPNHKYLCKRSAIQHGKITQTNTDFTIDNLFGFLIFWQKQDKSQCSWFWLVSHRKWWKKSLKNTTHSLQVFCGCKLSDLLKTTSAVRYSLILLPCVENPIGKSSIVLH